jgi:beta-lactam-binding protein with PASTA domain
MKNFLIKWGKRPFIMHLLLAMLVSCVVIYVTLKWLDAYTLHNKAVIVPDIKGLQIEEAAPFLHNNGLRYNIIDSVFSKNARPGAIVELIPSVGSKVKEGRIVFLTVNAISSQMEVIPDVRDLSFRQAYALLKARGFESVEIEYIPGRYKDLAIGIALHGRLLEEGERVPLTAPIILKVSNGMEMVDNDSLSLSPDETPTNSDTETWF